MERQREARAAKSRANEEKKRKIENLRKAKGEIDVCLNRLIASPPPYLLQFTAFIHTYIQAEKEKLGRSSAGLRLENTYRPSAEPV